MRILAIRGENLASLAERFEIDFETEPLRGAGLFAITGETGAGKSTILDALCLALYDAFPRVTAEGVKEGVPDPSGQLVNADDPRSILRRGAGQGFAEADFVGRDGERYRARCELARARGRATGNLQKRIRSLQRIDAAGAVVAAVASGVEPVKAKIVELTDLTFEQFRRTVLLAQGDFDAFLRSDSKERADLLEKITGASIYGEISRRVHARAKAALDALQQLRRRREEVGLLAEETRAALETESGEAQGKRAALAGERESVLALLRRHEAIAQAEQRLEEAATRRERAAAALEALEETRERLRALERAEPLRAPLAQRAAAEAALGEAAKKDEAMRAAALVAAAALEQTTLAEAEASRALAQAIAEAEQFGPQWSQAERLDAQIGAAERETAEATKAAREAEDAARGKAEAEARLIADVEAAKAESAAAAAALERLRDAEPLHARWREIEAALADRRAAARTLAEGAARSAALEGVADAATKEIAALDAADRADEEQRATLAGQIEQRREALAVMKEEETSGRRRQLDEAARLAARLGAEAQRHARAQDAAARAMRDLDGATAGQENEERALAAAGAAREIAAARRGEVERLGEVADAAVSKAALALRASLVPDAPCPVCGAREHPHAHASEAAAAMIADLRARRDALRREIGEIETTIAASSGRLEAARERALDARRRGDEARAEIDEARARFDHLRAQWPQSVAAAEAPAIDDAPALAALAETIEREGAALDETLARARRLRADIDTLRQTFDRLVAAIGDRRRLREDAQARLAGAREEAARLTATREAATDGLRAVDRALAPYLPLCALTSADLDRDLSGATRRLAKMGEDFGRARERLAQGERALASLSQRLAGTSVEARTGAAAAEAAGEARRTREDALNQLRTVRAALLGGEPTASHRARFEARRSDAQLARDAAARKRSDADAAKAGADRDLAHAVQRLADASEQAQSAAKAFADALAAATIDEATARALLTAPAQERAELRARLETAQTAAAAAATEAEARARDLSEALAAGRPEESVASLDERRARAEAEQEALARRLGEIGEKLAADDIARGKAEALRVEIAVAEATQKSWAEVDAAIGSATGDKFRRFAQSVTLERLVALANRHLETLTPRYRLERSASDVADLGLQIVDRDLCDERRSTRSLSGGERFLASLSLALGLCSLEGRDSFVDTLFIDEGFGTLDQATLDVAVDALERLQGQGRKVGVISHVESLRQRIAVQIRVEMRGGGRSAVRIDARSAALA